jgi:hypothetical protein
MKIRFLTNAVIAVIGLMSCSVSLAQLSTGTQREVDHLLDYVARPGCEFNRNGSWFTGQEARAHLEKKFQYLEQRNLAPDAESFIQRAASESSISGKPYQVRCDGKAATASGPWLLNELKRFRETGAASSGKNK